MELPSVSYMESVVGELRSDHATIRVGSYRWPTDPVLRSDEPHIVTWIDRRGTPEFDAEVTLRDGRVIRAPFGALSFRPAGSSILVVSDGSTMQNRFVSCWISPDHVREALANCDRLSGQAAARGFNLKSPRIREMIRRLGAEARAPGFAHTLLVESGSAMLGVEVARTIDSSASGRAQATSRLAPWQVAKIRDRVHGEAGSLVGAKELADLCRISTGHLRRAFKATTGQTVHDYVSETVGERAAHLLVASTQTVDEIARVLGFAGPSGFTTAFQRRYGVTPGQYRRNRGAL